MCLQSHVLIRPCFFHIMLQAELLLLSEGSMNNNVEYKLKGLITFADSLAEGQEYRRAVVSRGDYNNPASDTFSYHSG